MVFSVSQTPTLCPGFTLYGISVRNEQNQWRQHKSTIRHVSRASITYKEQFKSVWQVVSEMLFLKQVQNYKKKAKNKGVTTYFGARGG